MYETYQQAAEQGRRLLLHKQRLLSQPVVQLHLVSSKRALGAGGWLIHSMTHSPFFNFPAMLVWTQQGSRALEKKCLHKYVLKFAFSHDTVVHSLTRDAVALSQTIGSRTVNAKLNHTAYSIGMVINDTKKLFHSAVSPSSMPTLIFVRVASALSNILLLCCCQ